MMVVIVNNSLSKYVSLVCARSTLDDDVDDFIQQFLSSTKKSAIAI